jgi:hypothetical protein
MILLLTDEAESMSQKVVLQDDKCANITLAALPRHRIANRLDFGASFSS